MQQVWCLDRRHHTRAGILRLTASLHQPLGWLSISSCAAGVVFNIILAFTVLVAQVHSTGYFDYTYGPGVQTGGVLQGGAGARYGLQRGDVILEIDGKPIKGGAHPAQLVVVATMLLRHC